MTFFKQENTNKVIVYCKIHAHFLTTYVCVC